MATSTTSVKNIILEGPDQYHPWFSATKGSVPEDLWEHFDPDLETSTELVRPDPVTFSKVMEGALLRQIKHSTLNSEQYTMPTSLNINDSPANKPSFES